MYARVVISRHKPDKTNEAIRLWREETVPALEQQKGFKGGYYLTDPEAGKAIAITLWETEADLEAIETGDLPQQQRARFAELLAGSPVAEHYEVSVEA